MIDSIKLIIPDDGTMDFSKLEDTGNFYDKKSYSRIKSVNIYKYKNLHIERPRSIMGNKKIQINGSLQKLVNGQNIIENDLTAIEREINCFSELIKIDIPQQKVVRVDICKDFKTDNAKDILENIYPLVKYHADYRYMPTLYFHKWIVDKNFTSCFYDKGVESGKLIGLLRHELRLFSEALKKLKISTLADVLGRVDELNRLREDNMREFKAKERTRFDIKGTKRDLILIAREIGVEKIYEQLKDEFERGLVSRRTYYTRKHNIKSHLHLIENQEFEGFKL